MINLVGEVALFLQSYSFFRGGGIGTLFNYWEQAGFFSYVLPFIIIFSIVFAVLTKINLFQSARGIPAIIAASVGLLSLQFDVVPLFFSEIFPRVGIGLSILLVIFIFLGAFIDPEHHWIKYMLFAFAGIILLFVLFQSSAPTSWYDLYYFFDTEIFSFIVMIVFILAVIGIATKTVRTTPRRLPEYYPVLFGGRPVTEAPTG